MQILSTRMAPLFHDCRRLSFCDMHAYKYITRKHSCRMRTARLPTECLLVAATRHQISFFCILFLKTDINNDNKYYNSHPVSVPVGVYHGFRDTHSTSGYTHPPPSGHTHPQTYPPPRLTQPLDIPTPWTYQPPYWIYPAPY